MRLKREQSTHTQWDCGIVGTTWRILLGKTETGCFTGEMGIKQVGFQGQIIISDLPTDSDQIWRTATGIEPHILSLNLKIDIHHMVFLSATI